MSASGWIHLDVEEITRETDSAFLLILKDGEDVWMPKSQIKHPEDYEAGDVDVCISVTEWIANQKGLA